jgi:hypothetical protein
MCCSCYSIKCPVVALADAIEDMGALASLTFCGHTEAEGDPVTINTKMTTADFSEKRLGPAGAHVLAAFMLRKFFLDNRELTSLDISSNCLGPEGAKFVAPALKVRPKKLCEIGQHTC